MPEETQLDRVEKQVGKIVEWIEGNGKVGAKVQLDRHDRDIGIGKWFAAAVVLTGIGAAMWAIGQAIIAHAG